jgi:hypothetical protein
VATKPKDLLFEVKRIIDLPSSIPVIEYTLKVSLDEPSETIRLEGDFLQTRELLIGGERYTRRRAAVGSRPSQSIHRLETELQRLVRSSWLSVNRASFVELRPNDPEVETAIDLKVRQLHGDFPKYFSSLDSMAQTRLRQFQESFFLVLLTEPRLDKQATLYYSPSYNLDEEQKALEQIFFFCECLPYRSRIV